MTWSIGLVLLGIAAVIWKLTRRGRGDATFVVRVTGPGVDGVVLDGDVPGLGHADFVAFVAGLELPAGAEIWAIPDRDRVALRFTDVPEGLQQRVRNLVLSRYR